MNPIDAFLFFVVIRERVDWLRLLAVVFVIAFWVGFFLALRRAV